MFRPKFRRRKKKKVKVCRITDAEKRSAGHSKSERTTLALRENLCEARHSCISPDSEEALIISPAADTAAWCIVGKRDFKHVPLSQ